MKNGLLSWAALLLAAVALVMLHLEWTPQLPERVAVHFGSEGKANRWAAKDASGVGTLWVHLGTAGFVVLLTSLVHHLPANLVNVPKAEYWRRPENYPRTCRWLSGWGRWFAAAHLAWACGMDRQLFLANLRQPARLDSDATLALIAAAILGTAVMTGLLMLRFMRVPED